MTTVRGDLCGGVDLWNHQGQTGPEGDEAYQEHECINECAHFRHGGHLLRGSIAPMCQFTSLWSNMRAGTLGDSLERWLAQHLTATQLQEDTITRENQPSSTT
jgi:hypothetical protein